MEANSSIAIEEGQPVAQTNVRARQHWIAAALLGVVLVIGALFRFTGMNWDDYTHLHPDERFLTMVETSLSLPGEQATGNLPAGCAQWGGYFDTKCSPLSPYNHGFDTFVYGTFPMFLTRIVGEAVDQTGYDQIHLVGRFLSAIFDLSTVLLIFFIGRRLYDWRVGVLGALFLAGSVLDIQQSHFFTVDTFTNVPILIAFWYALDIADGKKWPAFLLAGAAFGLALAGRINIAPFAAVLIAACALRAYRAAVSSRHSQEALDEDPATLSEAPTDIGSQPRVVGRSLGPLSISVAWREHEERGARARGEPLLDAATRAFVGLAVIAIVALVFFRIFQPYAANGPNFISPTLPKLDFSHGSVNILFDVALSWAGGVNPQFAGNMQWASDLVSGKVDYPPGHQWTNRTPYVFPFENMVLWGLGPAMGLAAWIGFLVALYELVRYRKWEHLLIVVWVGVTFAYTGQQFVKTMRYFLQIYPFLALLAAWLIIRLWDAAVERSRSAPGGAVRWSVLARAAVGVIAAIVVGYTLFWATAFTSIYTRPYTRVAASRWVFDNVPVGSVIANEHWDDPVPVRVDGKDPFGGMYRGLSTSSDGELQWYAEDTPEKRTQAIQWLDEAQYIVLSSNRLYGSITRLPMRYPMTTKYYQWLFEGTLGFDRVATFASRPQFFGIQIDDDNAEEAFTVYDHPKVIIFKKSARYSHANTQSLFDSVDLTEVYRLTPVQATQAKTALLLTPAQWDAQIRGGTWSSIFNPDDWINRIPVVGWLAMLEILGWLTFPLAFLVFRRLADRGYIFAKTLGILIPAWGAWMLGSLQLVPFGRFSIALVLLALVVVSALAVRLRWRELSAFFRAHYRVVLLEEILFLAFFGLDLAIRYGNPDLWHPWYGGEKPMDYAFLNAVLKSTWFPAYDPWFAGGYINYYYFGQLITASLIRLSGIVPEIAYNLALPMYFALLAMGAFSVVFNLASPRRALAVAVNPTVSDAARPVDTGTRLALALALLAALFVAVIGNLGEVVLIGQTLAKIGGGDSQGPLALLADIARGAWKVFVEHQPFDIQIGWWYWNATRVIPDTINEFPFFTFLYADLHAHLMGLPFTLLTLGLCANFVLPERDPRGGLRLVSAYGVTISLLDVLEVGVAGLVLGALRAINTWDFPTYLAVITSALAIREYARSGIGLKMVLEVGWRLAAIGLLSIVLFEPFVANYATSYLSFEVWKGERTTLGQYLVVHGIFLFVIATYLVWQTFDTKAARGFFRFVRLAIARSDRLGRMLDLHHALAAPPSVRSDFVLTAVVITVLAEFFFLAVGLSVFAVAFPLLVLAGLLVLRPNLAPERRFIALLCAAGLAMTLMVEVIVLKGDIGRMNTVFKFYLQVWTFFALSAAAGLAFMLQQAPSVHHERAQSASLVGEGASRPSPRLEATGGELGLSRPAFFSLPVLWWTVFGLLLFAGALYPVFATRAKVNDRFTAGMGPGLNGMDYMKTAVYADRDKDMALEYDRQAIEWLRENIQGSPVILEGNSDLYHWGSRVSINTGLPTVIGWDWHEKQQRSIIDGVIIDQRIADVRTIYNTQDIAQAVKLLDRFRVSYVYVGDMERAYYDAGGLQKFDTMARDGQLELVYENQHVRIYRVKA